MSIGIGGLGRMGKAGCDKLTGPPALLTAFIGFMGWFGWFGVKAGTSGV